MTEAQKRQLGKNMKPRDSKAVEEQVEAIDDGIACLDPEQASETPSLENQQDTKSSIPAVEENFSDQRDHKVEAETEPVQHVAGTSGFGEVPPAVPEDVFSHLETLMKQSREATGADPSVFEVKQPGAETIKGIEQVGGIYIPTQEEVLALTGEEPFESEALHPERYEHLGEQPNGDYKAVVTVGEGYWPLVQAGAEADGISASEWLSQRLREHLEAYSIGPRSA